MTNTKQFIRFSWNFGRSSIKRSDYCPTYTDERATFDEVDRFLSEVERIYFKIMKPVYVYGTAALLYTAISLLFNILGHKEEKNNQLAWLVEAAWYLSYLFVFSLGYFFYEYKKEKVVSQLQLLIQLYHTSFGAKELRWVIPGDFPEGIELWKDYQVSNMKTYIEIGDPSSNSESVKLVSKGMP